MSLLLDAIQKAEQRDRKTGGKADKSTAVSPLNEDNPDCLESATTRELELAIDLELLDESAEPSIAAKANTVDKKNEQYFDLATDSDDVLKVGPVSDQQTSSSGSDLPHEPEEMPLVEPVQKLAAESTADTAATNPVEINELQHPPTPTDTLVDNKLDTTGTPIHDQPAPIAIEPTANSKMSDASGAGAPVQANRKTVTLTNVALLFLLGLSFAAVFYYFASQSDSPAYSDNRVTPAVSESGFFKNALSGTETSATDNEQRQTATTDREQTGAESPAIAAETTETGNPTNPQPMATNPIAPAVDVVPPVAAKNNPNDPNNWIDPGFKQSSSSRELIIRRTVPANNSALKRSAQTALQQGDLPLAGALYQQWLTEHPHSIGARFGLAKVASLRSDMNTARTMYLDILQIDPKNPAAQASLLNLPGLASKNTVRRLQGLLDQHPNDGYLNYVMGNHHAQLGLWGKAQQRYFGAFAAQGDNAAYAFNLAIALDHLSQPAAAADYYRQALALTTMPLNDAARQQAQSRLNQLVTSPG